MSYVVPWATKLFVRATKFDWTSFPDWLHYTHTWIFIILVLGTSELLALQWSTLSFLAGCPKSHFLGWYRYFLVYWYLKLDNQVVHSTCPKDELGWIWRADDPYCRTLHWIDKKKKLYLLSCHWLPKWYGLLSLAWKYKTSRRSLLWICYR